MKLPQQPLYMTNSGIARFVKNSIVDDLLDFATRRGFGMNEIACREYTPEERMQFAQLIGYSLGGYGDLSYTTDESYNEAVQSCEQLSMAHQFESVAHDPSQA